MKFLRNTLDKMHPLFDKGGKLELMYPLYEAADTFLYTPGYVAKGLTHIRDSLDLKRMMTMVVVALIPCVLDGHVEHGLPSQPGHRTHAGGRLGAGLRLAQPHSHGCSGLATIRPVSWTTLCMGPSFSCRFTSPAWPPVEPLK